MSAKNLVNQSNTIDNEIIIRQVGMSKCLTWNEAGSSVDLSLFVQVDWTVNTGTSQH